MTDATLAATGPVAVIGLGRMGLPMAGRLSDAGIAVRGADLSAEARTAFAARGGDAFDTAKAAARGTAVAITMLPDGAVVREALIGTAGAVGAMAPGGLAIDMSSSAPMETRRLAGDLAERGVALIDAPVSGGVKRAIDGSLAIMAGGKEADIARARPLLSILGKTIVATGPVGSGHAVKALNNYVSAAGLQAACEAALIAERFGVDPGILVDVLNVSTGRNNSTEVKMKQFILSGSFASGFAMALMAKDLKTAADLAVQLGLDVEGAQATAVLWTRASAEFGAGADHTEIYRYLAARGGRN